MAHTVMVTGADGFIGSHLTEELVKRGEKVRAFCLYNSFGSLGWIDTLPPEQGLAIRLKYVEDMTLQEIAAQFGVQPKTIKSRIHDGTVKLRKIAWKGWMTHEIQCG